MRIYNKIVPTSHQNHINMGSIINITNKLLKLWYSKNEKCSNIIVSYFTTRKIIIFITKLSHLYVFKFYNN